MNDPIDEWNRDIDLACGEQPTQSSFEYCPRPLSLRDKIIATSVLSLVFTITSGNIIEHPDPKDVYEENVMDAGTPVFFRDYLQP